MELPPGLTWINQEGIFECTCRLIVTVRTPTYARENRVLRDTPESAWQDRLQRDAGIETLAGQGRTAKCNFPDTTFSSSTKPPSGD